MDISSTTKRRVMLIAAIALGIAIVVHFLAHPPTKAASSPTTSTDGADLNDIASLPTTGPGSIPVVSPPAPPPQYAPVYRPPVRPRPHIIPAPQSNALPPPRYLGPPIRKGAPIISSNTGAGLGAADLILD